MEDKKRAGRILLVDDESAITTNLAPFLERTGFAAYVVELIDRFTYEDEKAHPSIFRLLTETLARVNSEPNPWLAIRYYEIRLLDHLGFRPQLFACANCEKDIQPEDQFFSFVQGGVLCPRCGQGLPNAHSISVEALKYLRHFQRSTYREALRARPAPDVQKEVEDLMGHFLTYLLERELNTPGFIRRIRKQG